MLKHAFYLSLAIAVGLAVAKMFGGSFNLSTLFGGTTTTTTTPCHLAAVAFDESFEDGPRVKRVRRFLAAFAKTGPGQRALVNLYAEYGARVAAVVRRSRILSALNGFAFGRILRHADAV